MNTFLKFINKIFGYDPEELKKKQYFLDENYHRLENYNNDLKVKLSDFQTVVKYKDNELRTYQDENNRLKKELSHVQNELETNKLKNETRENYLKKQCEEKDLTIEELTKRNATNSLSLKEEISSKENIINELNANIDDLKKKIENINNSFTIQNNNKDDEIERLKIDYELIVRSNIQLHEQNHNLTLVQGMYEKLIDENKDLKIKYEQLEKQKGSDEEIRDLERQNQKLEEEIADNKKDYSKLKFEYSESQTRCHKFLEELNNLKTLKIEFENAIEEMRLKLSSVNNENNKLQESLKKDNAEKEKLETLLKKLQEKENFDSKVIIDPSLVNVDKTNGAGNNIRMPQQSDAQVPNIENTAKNEIIQYVSVNEYGQSKEQENNANVVSESSVNNERKTNLNNTELNVNDTDSTTALTELQIEKQSEEISNNNEDSQISYIEHSKSTYEPIITGKQENPDVLQNSSINESLKYNGEYIPATKVKVRKLYNKENEAVEKSKGEMVDFPEIQNDSNKLYNRSIFYVYDEKGDKIYADNFFNSSSAEEIAHISRKLSEAAINGGETWTCGCCSDSVKIGHRKVNGKETLFFTHVNRPVKCDWVKESVSHRKNNTYTDSSYEEYTERDIYQEYQQLIADVLQSSESIEMKITDVEISPVIKSKVPYSKWRSPDISFKFNGRKIVIMIQKPSYSLDQIVERDIFFRLNDIQIIWLFPNDKDSTYKNLTEFNYKNTMFDNRRNVFVFDEESRKACRDTNTLQIKCNWLDKDNKWAIRYSNFNSNGRIIGLDNLTFDDESCKPFYIDANKEYFDLHPEAYASYINNKKSRVDLLDELEYKWIRDSNYEKAQSFMRQHNLVAELIENKGLWGFRFNTTILINPIFDKKPQKLANGYWEVQKDGNIGIVNPYGQKKIRWDGFIQCEGMSYDDKNNRILFKRNNKWGVADLQGKKLISPQYDVIKNWNNNVYRVKIDKLWGLIDIADQQLAPCIYDSIGELTKGVAKAVKNIKNYDSWQIFNGIINEDGSEKCSVNEILSDGNIVFENFEHVGVKSPDGSIILPSIYECINIWHENLYRVKFNEKWGVWDINTKAFIVPCEYKSIGNLINGKANIIFQGQSTYIDVNGKEVEEAAIELKNGMRKTKYAGKWGIVYSDGKIIIPHKYDEIGSFRSRMIGIINNRIVKLDCNYEYPICISGKCMGMTNGKFIFNIAGVECKLNKQYNGDDITNFLDENGKCDKLGFMNIIYKNKNYVLKILNEKNKNKRLSHGEQNTDFELGQVVTAHIYSIKYKRHGKSIYKNKINLQLVECKTSVMLKKDLDKYGLDINLCNIGDSLKLKKIGYNDELDRTVWEILTFSSNCIQPEDKDKILFVRIDESYHCKDKNNKFYRDSLYEATRKYWPLSKVYLDKINLIVAHADGIVREVIRPTSWKETENPEYKGKIEFEGEELPNSVYIGKTIFKLFSPNKNTVKLYNI